MTLRELKETFAMIGLSFIVAFSLGIYFGGNWGKKVGLDYCTKAVRIIKDRDFFVACYEKDGRPLMTYPIENSDTTETVVKKNNDGSTTVSIEYRTKLETYDLSTRELVKDE